MCFMVMRPMRTWTRVLALVALVVALAGGSLSVGAPRYGPTRHDIEARQGISAPDSAEGGQLQGHLARKLVTRYFRELEVESSLTVHGSGPVLQGKAQPPPSPSERLASTLRPCPAAYSVQVSPASIGLPTHPGSGLRRLQSLYTRHQFSRPPPFFLV